MVKPLNRLNRSKSDIKNELEYFSKNHIRGKVLDIPTTLIELENGQNWIFEMINNILIEGLTSIAEQERITTRQHQAEGIVAAKGKHLSRPAASYPPDWERVYVNWRANEITVVEAMGKLGLKRATFYKLVQTYEEGEQP